MTKVSWVKDNAGKNGAKTNDYEKQNIWADAQAEKACAHEDSTAHREGYCSQFDTLRGAVIDEAVVAHKMGPTVLKHLQQTQFLEYWQTRTGAGAWCENADIAGHAAACRRARKGNPPKCPARSTKV